MAVPSTHPDATAAGPADGLVVTALASARTTDPAPRAESRPVPPSAAPKLCVLRGEKPAAEYPLQPGPNLIGRAGDIAVDVDLDGQEVPNQVWVSRRHANIVLADGVMTVEDLHSLNGTFVNRGRVLPGRKQRLAPGDVLQIGTVQLRVE